MIYPDDANGDALRRMEGHGDDLTKPRNIDFTVVFPDQSSAEQFAEHFRGLGLKVSVRLSRVNQDLPWDALVVKHMAPSYEEIVDFEDLLQSVAELWGGRNDGWGCFSEPRAPS